MEKTLGISSPAPKPTFDPVSWCTECGRYARMAASAWRHIGPIGWIAYDAEGGEHWDRDHGDVQDATLSSQLKRLHK